MARSSEERAAHNPVGTSTRTGRTGKGILVIVWHLLADPTSRYRDLGPDFFDTRLRPERRKNNHIRQLEALASIAHASAHMDRSRAAWNVPNAERVH